MGLRKVSEAELQEILNQHRLWLQNNPGGKRANLSETDLHDANLRGVNLSCADLGGADLRGANLRGAKLCNAKLCSVDLRDANLRNANLYEANLRNADLYGVDLCNADLYEANLCNANLRNTDLCGVDLRGANLRNAKLSGAKNLNSVLLNKHTYFFALQCPEKGSYIAYTKENDLIVELEISADALRSSATTRKCRASKAKVLSITHVDGSPAENQVASDSDPNFLYVVGETVEVKDFDTDRWNECATGIHHFLTRQEAVMYVY